MSLPAYPILVVSSADESRDALVSALAGHGVVAAPCASFCQAEELALIGVYNGLLVDLPSIIKAKGEEKIVAYTLANFFPTLRVRAMGTMLVPMTMPGSAKQDKSLQDFLAKTCAAFTPRMLRAYRRQAVCIAVLICHGNREYRSFSLNVSWGGMFLVHMEAEEHFAVGDDVEIIIPEFGCSVRGSIRATYAWGARRAPGIGLCFDRLDECMESVLAGLLKSRREFDRDRLIG